MQTMEEVLGSHPFFAGLNAGAMRLIAGCASNVHFAEGEFLFEEGHEANQFWVIRRGRVAMQLESPGQGAIVFDTMDEGEVVGWSWLVPPYRFFADGRQVRGRSGAGISAAEAGHLRDVPAPAVHADPAARPVRHRTRASVARSGAAACSGRPHVTIRRPGTAGSADAVLLVESASLSRSTAASRMPSRGPRTCRCRRTCSTT